MDASNINANPPLSTIPRLAESLFAHLQSILRSCEVFKPPLQLDGVVTETSKRFRNSVESSQSLARFEQVTTRQYLFSSDEAVLVCLGEFDKCLQAAWDERAAVMGELLGALADASRDPMWRLPFGGLLEPEEIDNPQATDAQADGSILARILLLIQGQCDEFPAEVLQNALRLVGNCVADTDRNRRLALRKGAVDTLMLKAQENREVDLVVNTLFNLCVEYEDGLETPVERGATDSSPANPAQVVLAHYSQRGSVMQSLLGMTSMISHQRKQQLSGLIEMISLTAPDDLICLGLTPETDKENRKQLLKSVFNRVLCVEGPVLALYNGEACVSMCAVLVNLLSIQHSRSLMISEKLLHCFSELYSVVAMHTQEKSYEDTDTLINLEQYKNRLLEEAYAISGLPEFADVYSLKSELMQPYIERIIAEQTKQTQIPTAPQLVIACVFVTNTITTSQMAAELASGYRVLVQKALVGILLHEKDPDILYPTLGLTAKLALPDGNKQDLVENGIFAVLRPFYVSPRALENNGDVMHQPRLQREAINIIRTLVAGHEQLLAQLHRIGPGQCFRDMLELFTDCNDPATKIEIGRLFVEHFRTCRLSDSPLSYDSLFQQSNLAEPIAFLASEGPNEGAKGEGWFGLGLMTSWEGFRVQVLTTLKTAKMLGEVDRILGVDTDSPLSQNVKFVLARLKLEDLEDDSAHKVLRRAAIRLNLG